MISDPTASAPLPEMGRIKRSGATSGGMPTLSSAGASSAPRYSIAPDARNIYTAVSSAMSEGRICTSTFSPSSAPRVSAV